MKPTKYYYCKVIQQNTGFGWDDNSEYETNSQFITNEASGQFRELKSGRKVSITLLAHDLKEYQFTGYPTRVIKRKKLRD